MPLTPRSAIPAWDALATGIFRRSLRRAPCVTYGGDRLPVALEVARRLEALPVPALLAVIAALAGQPLTSAYGLLMLVAFGLAARLPGPNLREVLNGRCRPVLTLRLLSGWGRVVSVLLLGLFLLRESNAFPRAVLLPWFALAPLCLAAGYRLEVALARYIARSEGRQSRYLVVGANDLGRELTRRLAPQTFLGFFDYRDAERIAREAPDAPLLGSCSGLADYVREHRVTAVYIALPLAKAPRIETLINALRDTTASVYFVPDLFAFDLIQAGVVDLNGLPALVVCDTPHVGLNAAAKRALDLVLGSLLFAAACPVLLATALAVRLSSPGPVLFRQIRYGLDGERIEVLKFRSMTVCDIGPSVRQATLNDPRITPVGRFLRRTSLDELPQLLNVLGGSMSLVGPRPHAVAHNEQYRRLIPGYMLRHKVRPGITGWAQVMGLRGETDTLEKMARRVHYDLHYLRHWSLGLDFRILARTLRIVWAGTNAH